MLSVIDDFIAQYSREYDYYLEAARLCAQQLETVLGRGGIRAIVTYRAKRADRLRRKVERRENEKKYKNVRQISRDIVDLAGVRIALYFPEDSEEVSRLIEDQFTQVRPMRQFPQHGAQNPASSPARLKRFAGYSANHFLVQLKEEHLGRGQERYVETPIEIQVASVLMHAWAEVEHDLAYKSPNGELSKDEYAILDEINGLVLAGEIALDRLQEAVRRRVSVDERGIRNHFELAAFLNDRIEEKFPKADEPQIGRVDVLLRFLELGELNQPEEISRLVARLDPDTERRPIVEQMVDMELWEHPEMHDVYAQARRETNRSDPYGSGGDQAERGLPGDITARTNFLLAWIDFEQSARDEARKRGVEPNKVLPFPALLQRLALGETDVQRVEYVHAIRNRLIHGEARAADTEVFVEAAKTLRGLTDRVKAKREAKPGNGKAQPVIEDPDHMKNGSEASQETKEVDLLNTRS